MSYLQDLNSRDRRKAKQAAELLRDNVVAHLDLNPLADYPELEEFFLAAGYRGLTGAALWQAALRYARSLYLDS